MVAERETVEMVSYDKVDPLPTENPFYFNENSKINQYIQKKDKKFPIIHYTIFGILIPVMVFLMGIFYIGGIWNPVEKIKDLKYAIVSEDVGCVGHPLCNNLPAGTTISSKYMGLNGKGAGTFEFLKGNKEDAIDLVEKHKYWMALHFPPTFTMDVLSNLNAVNTSYHEAAVDKIYDEARSYTTVNFMNKAFNRTEVAFFKELAKSMDAFGSFNPPFLIEDIHYKENNIHPVTGFGQNFCTFISFILIWIGTIATALITHFVFPLENHWIEKKDATHAIAKTIGVKTLTNGIIMFVICVIVSIIPFCCGHVTMAKGYGAVLFFFFFFSLCGLGINNCLVHLFHFINFYLIACAFMILQLISCGGLLHRDLQYGFFKIGKALPMFYALRELKYIYFESGKHTQAANVLIILGWILVLLPLSLILYYLELRVKRAKYLKENSKN